MLKKNNKEFEAGYFGKLPAFSDFIKFNSGLPEVLFIDKWIQDGLAEARLKLRNDWKQKYEALPPTRFYIPFQSTGRAAAGLIYSSYDKSGREFPLVVFSVTALKYFTDIALVPGMLEEILNSLDYHIRKEENLNELNIVLKSLNPEYIKEDSLSRSFQQFLSSTTLKSFTGRTGISARYLQEINLPDSDASGIRIFFNSDESSLRFDTAVFIKMLNHKLNLPAVQTSIFWNKDTDSMFNVIIFPFKLRMVNFIDLISPGAEDKRIINISSGEENQLTESDSSPESILSFL